MRMTAPRRLTDWQTYGHTSTSTLGTAAWKILCGDVAPERLAEMIERCASCSQLAPGRGHLVRGCWHQAAVMLLEQGLQPLPRTARTFSRGEAQGYTGAGIEAVEPLPPGGGPPTVHDRCAADSAVIGFPPRANFVRESRV